jgi:hypothetical protein
MISRIKLYTVVIGSALWVWVSTYSKSRMVGKVCQEAGSSLEDNGSMCGG